MSLPPWDFFGIETQWMTVICFQTLICISGGFFRSLLAKNYHRPLSAVVRNMRPKICASPVFSMCIATYLKGDNMLCMYIFRVLASCLLTLHWITSMPLFKAYTNRIHCLLPFFLFETISVTSAAPAAAMKTHHLSFLNNRLVNCCDSLTLRNGPSNKFPSWIDRKRNRAGTWSMRFLIHHSSQQKNTPITLATCDLYKSNTNWN